MKNLLHTIVAACLLLAIAGVAFAGEHVEIRTGDGTWWRGEIDDQVTVSFREQRVPIELTGRLVRVEDLFIVVEGDIAGELRQKLIYRGDILSMSSAAAPAAADTARTPRRRDTRQPDAAKSDDRPGVFVLPLDGPVGEDFRVDEIRAIGEKADEYGPGQIIVLDINSNGGLVLESELITEAIWDIKKRHRVVAWVRKAISAGAQTAMVCDEIYFRTDGTVGSVTTIRGLTAVSEEEAQPGIDFLVRVAREAGYSEHIARAMKLSKYMCSYDKDEETGEVTFYGDLSGEYVLSDGKSNLTFTSSKAMHCGFAKGIADTTEDLAKLLDLPEWYEKSDYGRRIAKEWQDTAERARTEIQRLIARRDYYKSAGSQEERIGAMIQIDKQLIRWWDRAPNIARTMLPEKEVFEREIEELRRQLARLNR